MSTADNASRLIVFAFRFTCAILTVRAFTLNILVYGQDPASINHPRLLDERLSSAEVYVD